MQLVIELLERGLIPEPLARSAIRQVCRERLAEEALRHERNPRALFDLIELLAAEPLAVETKAANEQHYELPPDFFAHILGRHRKYSSCYFEHGNESLDDGEGRMLELTCERAELGEGQQILELGCGWGSLSLFMAKRYPTSQILAISNSAPQREYIESQIKHYGLTNLRIETCDINRFEPKQQFDRIVSVEMFEHLRNYTLLFSELARWLKQDGKVFVHIFCHRHYAYLYETEGETNWMGRYFFTGGTMPSESLLSYAQHSLAVEQQWWVPGRHYGRTADLWACHLQAARAVVMPILATTYGADKASRWFQRWWLFFLACAELFHYRGGTEWGVTHILFAHPTKALA